jgi:hypothetical protein
MALAIFLARLGLLHMRGRRHVADMHRAAADKRTAARAGAQFRKSHTNGHRFSLP